MVDLVSGDCETEADMTRDIKLIKRQSIKPPSCQSIATYCDIRLLYCVQMCKISYNIGMYLKN